MSMHRCGFAIALLLLAVTGLTVAQQKPATAAPATQPAPDEWGQMIGLVARGLSGDADAALALQSIIPDGVPIRHFGVSELESRTKMKEQTDGLKSLVECAYVWPIETAASDLAADFRDRESLPDAVRRQFLARDEDLKRANAVAQQWIGNMLRPAPGQYLGLIVLWEPPAPVNTTSLILVRGAEEPSQPVFVLIKGMKSEDGQFHVTQVVYGDARQALN